MDKRIKYYNYKFIKKMKCLCNLRIEYLKEIDMFGKEPELYYKGRPKKKSWMGRILSILFVFNYFVFFII